MKVKLPNSNVASRVLPIRIHELDNEDVKLCESVIEGVLRGIEFIYKSPGVNRPLLPKENNPQENLNHTDYRDQINKVANAIKEISTALKRPSQHPEEITNEVPKPVTTPYKSKKIPIIITSVATLALIILGILFIPKLFKPPEEIEKSIAVLPFLNESTDQENSAFVNGLMEKTLNNLQLIKDFRVISRTSVEQYRNQNKSAPEIAKELGVNYIVEGSGQRYGDAFSISVQLIKAYKREDHLWGKSFEQEIREVDDILKIQSEIAQAIAKELEANITAEEKRLIDKVPTNNLTALDFYQQGIEEHWRYLNDPYNLDALGKAEDLYNKALEYDPAFGKVYLGLAQVYWDKNYIEEYLSENFMDSALVLANTALDYDDDLAEAYVLRGDYYRENGYYEKALEEYDKAININPSSWQAYVGRYKMYNDVVRGIDDLHKALSLCPVRERPYLLENLCLAYMYAGFMDIGQKYNQERLKLTNDSSEYLSLLARSRFWLSNLKEALMYYNKAYLLDSMNIEVLFMIGMLNGYVEHYEESLLFCEKWLEQLDKTLVTQFRYNGMNRVGYAYWKNNRFEEANYYFYLQMKYCNGSINAKAPSYGAYYDRAGIYAFRGEKKKAYEDLRMFINQQIVILGMVNLIKILKLNPQSTIRDYDNYFQLRYNSG